MQIKNFGIARLILWCACRLMLLQFPILNVDGLSFNVWADIFMKFQKLEEICACFVPFD